MDALLPQAYLIGLIVLLGVAAVVVARQIWRVRSDEVTLAKLERVKALSHQTRRRCTSLALCNYASVCMAKPPNHSSKLLRKLKLLKNRLKPKL